MNTHQCWVFAALLGVIAGCQKKEDAAPATVAVRCTSGGAAQVYHGVVHVGSHVPSGGSKWTTAVSLLARHWSAGPMTSR